MRDEHGVGDGPTGRGGTSGEGGGGGEARQALVVVAAEARSGAQDVRALRAGCVNVERRTLTAMIMEAISH